MNEGVCLAVEVDPHHIERRLETGYCDEMASTLDEALAQVREACNTGQPLSIGLIGNAAEVYPELVRRNITPAMVTDQTSAHDALNGYIPAGLSAQEAAELRKRDPQEYVRRSMQSMVTHVQAMLEMQKRGDWPILNALLNTASGATWVSVHHGGGVGIGYSLHAGQVIVADGTPEAAEHLQRVLTNGPGSGVIRHVDAGYEEAVECAQELGVKIPML